MQGLIFDNNLNHLKAYFKQIYKAQHEVEVVSSEWLRKLCNSWLKEEFYFQAGAEYYQRSPNRLDYGNGYYRRYLLTASGRIELNVPRGKRRRYKYTLFDKYKRYSKKFEDIVIESLLLGHSTRDARRFFDKMFGKGSISQSLGSKILRRFDFEIEAWKKRSIKKEVTILVLDAIHLKGSITGLKRAKPVLFAYCIYKDGQEEVLDFEPRRYESLESWHRLCGRLYERGLRQVELVVRDDNKAIREAVSLYWPSSKQQFCIFHLMQNFIKYLKGIKDRKKKQKIINNTKKLYKAKSKEEFYSLLNHFMSIYRQYKYHPAFKYLFNHLEESTQFYEISQEFHPAAKTTNRLERIFKEIKRRHKAFGRFPNTKSCQRWIYAFIKEGLIPQYRRIKSAQDY